MNETSDSDLFPNKYFQKYSNKISRFGADISDHLVDVHYIGTPPSVARSI